MSQYDFNIVFPKITIAEEISKFHKVFSIDPLESGYGITVGNALRRIALSTLPGGAAKKIKIKGVAHEFDIIKGALEDVTTVVLTIKDLKVKIDKQDEDFTLELKASKKGELTAGDLICPAGVEVINKDLKIVTLTEDVDFQMEVVVNKGRGYVLSEENRAKDKRATEIYIDSIYTPVEKFSYEVKDTRVGDKTNYDKLLLTIETNGMLTPEEALSMSAQIMMGHMDIFANIEESIKQSNIFLQNIKAQSEKIEIIEEKEETSIETLDISNRAYNGLKRANIDTIEQLAAKSKREISNLENIGAKTVDEIEQQLEDLGLRFKQD